MGIKRYKPTSAARRFMTVSTYEEITTTKPERSLLEDQRHNAGRNAQGKITVRHRGGGNRRKYRIIDFKRNKDGIEAVVKTIEYDPNRTANIALLCYKDGEKRYILAPLGLNVGDVIVSGKDADIKVGNALPLEFVPVGTMIHNIELQPGKGGQIARSAGMAAQLMAKENGMATLKMPSGEMRYVSVKCKATIGQVGNLDHEIIRVGKAGKSGAENLARSAGMAAQLMAKEGGLATLKLPSGEMRYVPVKCKATVGQIGNLDHEIIRIGKAGKKRHMGIRPTVRGSVMNPCDHPHGGGEGRAPVGHAGPLTPWGKPALGYKTRKKKNKSDKFILKRVN